MKWTALYILFLPLAFATPMPVAPQQASYPLCTQAQHDAYTIKGPDGATYVRWHPQIDQRLHCSYGHEHGSDPGLILPSLAWPYEVSAAETPFGYVSSHHMMTEPHEGFKLFAFDDRVGHLWLIELHQGSSGVGRVCTRFHEVQVRIWDSRTWELLASVGFMGDFGAAVSNQGQDLTPTACPTQAADARADGSTGLRQFQIYSQDGHVLYDPWRLDDHRLIIPIDLHSMTFWPESAINDCQDLTCDTLLPNINVYGLSHDGSSRFFQYYPGTGIKASSVLSGTFYTDPLGRQLLDASDLHAVKQYIRSSSAFALPQPAGKCLQWGVAAVYHCGGYGQGWPYTGWNGVIGAPN